MNDRDIELVATLAIWAIGTVFFASTVGWYAFLYAFKALDDYLHS